jgi:hypothetical protein
MRGSDASTGRAARKHVPVPRPLPSPLPFAFRALVSPCPLVQALLLQVKLLGGHLWSCMGSCLPECCDAWAPLEEGGRHPRRPGLPCLVLPLLAAICCQKVAVVPTLGRPQPGNLSPPRRRTPPWLPTEACPLQSTEEDPNCRRDTRSSPREVTTRSHPQASIPAAVFICTPPRTPPRVPENCLVRRYVVPGFVQPNAGAGASHQPTNMGGVC